MSWQELLPCIRVGGALPVTFAMTDLDAAGNECACMEMIVPHVGDPELTPGATSFPLRIAVGTPIPISIVVALPPWSTRNAALMFLRDKARWFYMHELDEQFRVHEVRVFEPVFDH